MTAVTRIAVVDDEESLRETLGIAFRREGWAVETYSDGAAACHALLGNEGGNGGGGGGVGPLLPDALVLDILLPRIDGLEVLRRLRAGRARALPVLLLSSKGEEFDRVLGLEPAPTTIWPSRFRCVNSSPGCGHWCGGGNCTPTRPPTRRRSSTASSASTSRSSAPRRADRGAAHRDRVSPARRPDPPAGSSPHPAPTPRRRLSERSLRRRTHDRQPRQAPAPEARRGWRGRPGGGGLRLGHPIGGDEV